MSSKCVIYKTIILTDFELGFVIIEQRWKQSQAINFVYEKQCICCDKYAASFVQKMYAALAERMVERKVKECEWVNAC